MLDEEGVAVDVRPRLVAEERPVSGADGPFFGCDGIGVNVGTWLLRLSDEIEALCADDGEIVAVEDGVAVHRDEEDVDTTTTIC